MRYENIIVETLNKVGIITLNRPHALNALNDALMNDLTLALDTFDADDHINVVIITGSNKVFAAGADISAMIELSYMDTYKSNYIAHNWERLRYFRKPVIAAVAGYAFGGGSELIMMCDIVIAAENTKFSQPEVKLGLIPGAGGTQRLPRAVGKAKAMDLCLTGRIMEVNEAERSGLVSRIVPVENLMEEAIGVAENIARYSLPITMMIKASINHAFESNLNEGIEFERSLFRSTFAMEDSKEGMAAFLEKRPAKFNDR